MERDSEKMMTRKRKTEQTDDKEKLDSNKKSEKDKEIENCCREMNEKNARLEKELAKQKKLIQEVTDQIECPVCLEVPRCGPVPVCPNGHLVCSSCKTASCPTCRTAMGNGNSLLAVTILENIDHRCKYDHCGLDFPLQEIKKHETVCKHRIVICSKKDCQSEVPFLEIQRHEKVCKYRTVSCPKQDCRADGPLHKLVQHLLGSEKCCFQRVEPKKVVGDAWNTEYFAVPNIVKGKKNWSMGLYSFDEEVFGVFPNKEGQFSFVLVMFSSEKECSKYKFEMVVHGEENLEDAETVSRFEGNPVSIDGVQEEINLFVTSEQFMRKILRKSSSKDSFGVTFKIMKK